VTSGQLRPVQGALLEGFADRPVGRIIPSVIDAPTNGELIRAIAPQYLYGAEGVLDPTYGRGGWWTRYRPADLVAHDLKTDGVDFRALPHARRTFDVVAFDPPYTPHDATSGIVSGNVDFADRYGLGERSTAAMLELIDDGLAEVARVGRRWVLVKCSDFVNGRKFHMAHLDVVELMRRHRLIDHDLIVHLSGAGPGHNATIRRPKRARRHHSYLIVGKVRTRRRSA
jgi:hypothetical protein